MENIETNSDTRPLPEGWVQHYETTQKIWYYVQMNTVPPKVSFQHPADIVYGKRRSTMNHPPMEMPHPSAPPPPPLPEPRLSFAQQLFASSTDKTSPLMINVSNSNLAAAPEQSPQSPVYGNPFIYPPPAPLELYNLRGTGAVPPHHQAVDHPLYRTHSLPPIDVRAPHEQVQTLVYESSRGLYGNNVNNVGSHQTTPLFTHPSRPNGEVQTSVPLVPNCVGQPAQSSQTPGQTPHIITKARPPNVQPSTISPSSSTGYPSPAISSPERLSPLSLSNFGSPTLPTSSLLFSQNSTPLTSPASSPPMSTPVSPPMVHQVPPIGLPSAVLSAVPAIVPPVIPSVAAQMPPIPSEVPSMISPVVPTMVPSVIPAMVPSVVPSMVPTIAPANSIPPINSLKANTPVVQSPNPKQASNDGKSSSVTRAVTKAAFGIVGGVVSGYTGVPASVFTSVGNLVTDPKIISMFKSVFSKFKSPVPQKELQAVLQGNPNADYQAVIDGLQAQQQQFQASYLHASMVAQPFPQQTIDYQALIAEIERLQKISQTQAQAAVQQLQNAQAIQQAQAQQNLAAEQARQAALEKMQQQAVEQQQAVLNALFQQQKRREAAVQNALAQQQQFNSALPRHFQAESIHHPSNSGQQRQNPHAQIYQQMPPAMQQQQQLTDMMNSTFINNGQRAPMQQQQLPITDVLNFPLNSGQQPGRFEPSGLYGGGVGRS